MADEVVDVDMQGNTEAAKTAAAEDDPRPVVTAPQYSEDLMEQFGLGDVLNDLRSRKMRSSFSHYISEIPTDVVPLKPRCPAGSLMEVAMQPINEDERRLELFDERVLRNALTLKESSTKVPLPEWLDVEQPWGDEDRKRRKKDRKKKRKKKKRKRNMEDAGHADGDDGAKDDDERRAKKKRR